MINVELLKRMVSSIPGGSGGWMSSYMFYMNSCTHLGLRPVPVTRATLSGSAAELNSSFAEMRGMPTLQSANVGSVAGIGRLLDGVELDNARRNRMRQADAISDLSTSGVLESMQHSAVLQQTYMSHNYSTDDQTNDANNSGVAARTPFAPMVISALDASVLIDPVELAFNPLLDLSIKVIPEVTAQQGPLTLESLPALIESRLRDASSDYNVGYSGDPSANGGSIIGTDRKTTDSPHMIDRVPYYERSNPWLLHVLSTNLEVDDYTKIARFIGTTYLPGSASPQFHYNSRLLKFMLFPTAVTNANGICLVAFSRVGAWHSPIIGFLSQDRIKVPGVSNAISGPVVAPSCQIYGFATDASSKITTTAVARSPRTVVDVVRIDQPGLTGTASYFIERYPRDLINTTLTSHLPFKKPDGSKSTYFELGTFLTRAGSDIETQEDNGSSQFCLQPVSFAMAQQPEDQWLYYVSMDDNFEYWLNRQELGKAHESEVLCSLTKPPLQMEVFNGHVWMIHETRIVLYEISTRAVTTYGAAAGINMKLKAIAVDRELSKLYVGHTNGVFDFTARVVVPVAMPSARDGQKTVAPCKLTAVNGYLTWVTTAIEDRVSADDRPPNWAVRHEIATGQTLAWSCAIINSSDRHTHSVIATSLRSNGDLIVLHTGTYYNTPTSLTWFSVGADGIMRRKNTRHYFGYWEDAYESDYRLTSRIFRIDDHHFSILTIPVRLVQQTLDGTLGLFRDSDNGPSRPWTGDFRLDDAGCRIYFYPLPKTDRMTARQSVGNEEAHFASPYGPIPFASVYVRACDYEYAKYSSTVVILDKCYSLFVCGTQIPTSIGIELDWDGANWIHGTAGRAKRSRKTHSTPQLINPWSQITFGAGQAFDTYTAYQIKTFPSTSMSTMQAACYYLGDLIPAEATLQIATAATEIPPAINSPSYCGVEYERPELITCSVNGTPLTFHIGAGGTTPDETHFYVYKDTLYLHASHIGKTATLNYSYVKAVSP